MTAAHKTNRNIILVVLILAVVITLIMARQARDRMIKKIQTHSQSQVNDFDRWMVEVPEFLYQKVDYVSDSFPTPPVTLLVFAPFTFLSSPDAQFAWVCCKFLFCMLIFYCLWLMVRRTGVELSTLAVLLILAAWIWPVLGDMQEGQTNLLMLLPLAAGICMAQLDLPRWQWVGGALVGLAVCIKVTPIIFLIFFLFKRRWHIAGGILLGLLLGLIVIPALAFGWQQNMHWLIEWTKIMILPYVARGQVAYFEGQSVPSFLSRLLRHVPAFVSHSGTPVYVNVLNLPENVCNWIIRGVLGVAGLYGLWWSRKAFTTLRCRRYVLEVGAVGAFELWASQRTWVPHFVTLALTLFAVGMVLSDPRQEKQVRKFALFALIANAILMFMTSDVGMIFGPDGHGWLLTFGVSLWASVLLVAVIFVAAASSDELPAGKT
ncbi:MAG TPA: glycosyltransferase family 87 protein [Phycisphaerae bacterium]|nr:glycosyltransferase family 87 protein [Phycisphaerae bacterium]